MGHTPTPPTPTPRLAVNWSSSLQLIWSDPHHWNFLLNFSLFIIFFPSAAPKMCSQEFHISPAKYFLELLWTNFLQASCYHCVGNKLMHCVMSSLLIYWHLWMLYFSYLEIMFITCSKGVGLFIGTGVRKWWQHLCGGVLYLGKYVDVLGYTKCIW